MTRRQAIITAICASFATRVFGQTASSGTIFLTPSKLKLHLQLDDFEALEVQRGKAVIRITADEIWEELSK